MRLSRRLLAIALPTAAISATTAAPASAHGGGARLRPTEVKPNLPALGLTVVCFALYVTGVALFAQPGVFRALLTTQPLAIVFVLGPLAALAARTTLTGCCREPARWPPSSR